MIMQSQLKLVEKNLKILFYFRFNKYRKFQYFFIGNTLLTIYEKKSFIFKLFKIKTKI